jgi:hypothetical protein
MIHSGKFLPDDKTLKGEYRRGSRISIAGGTHLALVSSAQSQLGLTEMGRSHAHVQAHAHAHAHAHAQALRHTQGLGASPGLVSLET